MKKVYVNAQWQGGADRSTYDGAEELRKYLPGQDYVILPVSAEEAEMAVMRNGIRDLMFYTGRCSPLTDEYASFGTGNALVEKLIRFGTAL